MIDLIKYYFSAYKLYIYLTLALIALGSVGGAIWYVNSLQKENAALEQSVSTLQDSLKTQKETIRSLQEDAKKIKAANNNVNVVRDVNNKKLDNLNNQFKGFTEKTVSKTNETEAAINKATKDKLRCFELLTGQKANKDETNSSCPDYL